MYVCVCIYIYIYISHCVLLASVVAAEAPMAFDSAKRKYMRLDEATDGTGTPEPNPRHIINWFV